MSGEHAAAAGLGAGDRPELAAGDVWVTIARDGDGRIAASAGGISVTASNLAAGGVLYVVAFGGCPADVDGSGGVDFDDLLAVLAAFGECD